MCSVPMAVHQNVLHGKARVSAEDGANHVPVLLPAVQTNMLLARLVRTLRVKAGYIQRL